jgi:hypothetical protein
MDGVQDADETDVDCGGSCPACATSKKCKVGTDCQSKVCDPTLHTCAAASCTDGVKNGNETDVDCGGGTCQPCVVGKNCGVGTDCQSKVCDPTLHTCSMPSCTDGVKNGNETDVDCGGGTCAPCANGKTCGVGSDCQSKDCDPTLHTCSAPSCTDGVQNGNETDIDCGGGTCPPCAPGKNCMTAGDCTSGVCDPTLHTCSLGIAIESVAGSCYTMPGEVDSAAQTVLTAAGFDVTVVDGTALSTPAGIQQYGVVVFGAGAYSCSWDWNLFDPQLHAYVQQGGGLVVTGWATYYMAMNTKNNEQYPGLQSVLPATAGLQFNNGATDTIVPGHPITAGLTNFVNPAYTVYGAGTPAGATSLVTESGVTVAAAWTVGAGRVVYLGPIYMANYANYTNKGLLDGTIPSAKQLFINAVAWAGHKI